MREWVYIATPSGADLGRTVRLADGSVFRIGVIRRRVHASIPHLHDLQPHDTVLLTYDLFHTGVVLPIGVFRLAEPQWPRAPRVRPLPGYRAIGELADPRDRSRLEPDYVPDGEAEHVLLGELAPLKPLDALKVYARTDSEDHALHPAGPRSPLVLIDEGEQRQRLEQALVPRSELARRIIDKLPGLAWPFAQLDGRAKQLLIESRLWEAALGAGACCYALAALPLCFLAEYELQKLLTRAARCRLSNKQDLALGSGPGDPVLSWIPDPTVYESGFHASVRMLERLRPDELGRGAKVRGELLDRFYEISRFRNRVAHAYFLERKHYQNLRRIVAEMCVLIYERG